MKESKMLILGIIPLGHVSGLWLKMIVETGLDTIYFAQERECLLNERDSGFPKCFIVKALGHKV